MAGFLLGTPWFVPVLSKMFFGNIAAFYLLKRLSSGARRDQKLLIQFSLAASFAILMASVLGQVALDTVALTIALVGFVSAWATYAYWNAVAISPSKTGVFAFWNPGLSMLLSTIFLGERHVLSASLLSGIGLCMLAAIVIPYQDYRKASISSREKERYRGFYLSVAAYSIIWGLANFLVKKWSLDVVPVGTYLSGWYVGSLIGAVSLVSFVSFREKQLAWDMREISVPNLLMLALLTVAIFASLGSVYWSHFLAPQVVVFPLFMLGDIIWPLIMGFLFFKEKKQFNHTQLLCLFAGVAGGALVSWSV